MSLARRQHGSRPVRPLRRGTGFLLGGRTRRVHVLSGVARGVVMELDLGQEKEYWAGLYEPEVQAVLRSLVRPGSVFYDVGAHIGFFSLCAARLGARVYAFEPVPESAARLRRMAQINGLPIQVVEAAVWDSDRGLELVRGPSDRESRVREGGAVPSLTLDAFAAEHKPPDMLKVDVEGAEARVLAGAAALLREHRPAVVCEVHGAEEGELVRGLLAGYEQTWSGPNRVVAVARKERG